jgi:hypothetical protein
MVPSSWEKQTCRNGQTIGELREPALRPMIGMNDIDNVRGRSTQAMGGQPSLVRLSEPTIQGKIPAAVALGAVFRLLLDWRLLL